MTTFQTLSGMVINVRAGVRELGDGDRRPLILVTTANGDTIPVFPTVFNNIVGYNVKSADLTHFVGCEAYYDKAHVAKGEMFKWNRLDTEQQNANRDLEPMNLLAVIKTERLDDYLAKHCVPIVNDDFDDLVAGKPASALPKGMTEVPEDDIEAS